MKRFDVLLLIMCIGLMVSAMGWAPEPPNHDPDPPTVDKPTKILTDYYWGTSDEVVPGKAILMPHASLTGTILNAQVNDEQLKFELVYKNGQEIWSASKSADFYGKANLTVETKTSIYKSIIHDVVEPEEPVEPPSSSSTVEKLWHRGFTNGNRSTWYGNMDMSKYPSPMRVQIDGCVDTTINHNGHRYDSGGLLVKQSDVPGRGIAVLIEKSCRSKVARLIY